MLRNNAAFGMGTTYEACKDLHIRFCEVCQRGQMRKLSVPHGLNDYTDKPPMWKIGLDPVTLTHATYHNNKVLHFGLDYVTGMVWVYEAATNGNQRGVMQAVQQDFCVPYGHKIACLKTDFHSVFLSKEMDDFCRSEHIFQEATPPYEHGFNKVESCSVKPLLLVARKLLIGAKMSPRMAGFAVRSAAFIKNRTCARNESMSPLEKLTGQKPDLSIARPFGAPVLYHLSKEERADASDPRWSDRAASGGIVGYSDLVHGRYLILTNNQKIITRRHVVLLESNPASTRGSSLSQTF